MRVISAEQLQADVLLIDGPRLLRRGGDLKTLKNPELLFKLVKLVLLFGLTAFEAAKKVSREHDISFEEIWRMMPDRLR